MLPKIIIPGEHHIYHIISDAISTKRIVCFAGLPGVGKTLLLQQTALLAQREGRKVHLLQWDVARNAFETEKNLELYPEVCGVTHPMIRKATGLWSRLAILDWYRNYDKPHLLLIEMPLVGNRFIELVQNQNDDSETILQGEDTLFILPVPTKEVRKKIEDIRAKTTSEPRHEREAHDANPDVLRSLWHELFSLACDLDFAPTLQQKNTPYMPDVYRKTYEYLLKHRRVQVMSIDTVFSQKHSAYDLNEITSEPTASSEEVSKIIAKIDSKYDCEKLTAEVNKWYII
ncbi:hypothetical protein [Candidatus Uabimicrobium sp. HlEnr_7]|uniref:hypothetical protein n=1 Tax=Candidatus Uabimicrobium helgolandensis TaxID=3095367 RepID=UPI0035575174